MDASFDHSVLPTPSKSSPQIDSGLDDEDNFLEADLNHRYDDWIKNKIKSNTPLNEFRSARQNFFNFLLYWATTTSTSTSTSYTRTGVLSILNTGGCAPSGMSICSATSASCA